MTFQNLWTRIRDIGASVTLGLLGLLNVTVCWEDDRLESQMFTSGANSLPYRLLKPKGYESVDEERYPLVIFLHGIGERGTDNRRQLANGVEEFCKDEFRDKHPCFLIVPQCPPNDTWSSIRDPKGPSSFAENPNMPGALVLQLIEATCTEYRIDMDRIYITGISMGGYGTWDLICRQPEMFAAAIPVCGGGDPQQADKLVGLPIWAFHGESDNLIPPNRSRDMVAAIRDAGGEPRYTEHAGVGHDAWTPTYKDPEVLEWLFQQKKGDRR